MCTRCSIRRDNCFLNESGFIPYGRTRATARSACCNSFKEKIAMAKRYSFFRFAVAITWALMTTRAFALESAPRGRYAPHAA